MRYFLLLLAACLGQNKVKTTLTAPDGSFSVTIVDAPAAIAQGDGGRIAIKVEREFDVGLITFSLASPPPGLTLSGAVAAGGTDGTLLLSSTRETALGHYDLVILGAAAERTISIPFPIDVKTAADLGVTPPVLAAPATPGLANVLTVTGTGPASSTIEIYLDAACTGTPAATTQSDGGGAFSVTVSGIAIGAHALRAITVAGNLQSSCSPEIPYERLLVGTPDGLSATRLSFGPNGNDASAEVSWNAVAGAQGYTLYVNDAPMDAMPPQTLTTLDNGATYRFKVAATAYGNEGAASPELALELCTDIVPPEPGMSIIAQSEGVDGNQGKGACVPYKTITHALAAGPTNFYLAPGTYSADETFPIRMTNQRIVGDPATRGANTIIAGNALRNASPVYHYGVSIESSAASIHGVTIIGTRNATGNVVFTAIESQGDVTDSTIRGPSGWDGAVNRCIGLNASTNQLMTVSNNLIENFGTGLITHVGDIRVQKNDVRRNIVGIAAVGSPNPGPVDDQHDFGGGPWGSSGLNIMRCNTKTDMYILDTTRSTIASNNYWPVAPPSVVAATGGQPENCPPGSLCVYPGSAYGVTGAMTASGCP